MYLMYQIFVWKFLWYPFVYGCVWF